MERVRPSQVVVPAEAGVSTTVAEERISVATQWQLMWWRFRRHKLAMVGSLVVLMFYGVVLCADFLAYAPPTASEAQRSLMPPQRIRWFDGAQIQPQVYGFTGRRDPVTFKRVYTLDPAKKIPVRFFAHGFEYRLLGFIPTDRHLLGVEGANPEETLFLLGTDEQGRDLWSRLMYATRTSLTIGLAGVTIALVLGVLLGGISGLYGGGIDTVIQRVIEILRSIPTIPLWLGLAAALPRDWTIGQVYFAITLIISLIGWTELARVVRGRFLSLREEEFIMAAELAGSGQATVSWTAPVPLCGDSITGYIVTASPGGQTATVGGGTSSVTLTGLTNGTAYTFTVQATNVVGVGPASAPSNSVTPATLPGAPTAVTASPGNTQATVTWTAPASNGGSAITGYTVTAAPGGQTASVAGGTTTATVTGLTNGTAYAFTVMATNAVGTGPGSSPPTR